jgi:hypothetical protein
MVEIAKEPFWKSLRIYQLWRFMILNFKILKGVEHSKRLPEFVIKYKVSYVVASGDFPTTVANTRNPPQIGDRVRIARGKLEIIEVRQLLPPRGEFCPLQAICKIIDTSSIN